MTWWLPDLSVAILCVSAGLTVWWPVALLAIVPLIGPAAHLVLLPALQREHAQRQRAEFEAAQLAEHERLAPAGPVTAQADRLDRLQLTEAQP